MNPPVDERVGPPLTGCTVLVTREQRGELGRLLDESGAAVVHVPLIEVVDVEPDARARLDEAIASSPDWLIVTSAAGAERVGAVANDPTVRLAAVGTVTAQRLAEVAGRAVDLVPTRQLAATLVDEFIEQVAEPQRVVVAQADLAGEELADGLAAAGHTVDVFVAYRTVVREPPPAELAAVGNAHAVVFASGSAASGWAAAFGAAANGSLPSIVVAIGPTTAGAAAKLSLKVTHVAADHSLAGIVETLTAAWADASAA